MSTHAGQLRQLIAIRRQVDVSDGKGGFDRGWSTLDGDIPAAVRSLNGREAVLGHVLQGISSFEIVVRYRTDIRAADQVLFEGRELNIHAAEDRDGKRIWTTITASTEGKQGA